MHTHVWVASDDEKLLRLPHISEELEKASNSLLRHYEDCEDCDRDSNCPLGQRLYDRAFAAIRRVPQ